MIWVVIGILLVVGGGVVAALVLRRRGLDALAVHYFAQSGKCQPLSPQQEIHVLLCIADHYEPHENGVADEVARRRVQRWLDDYPRQFARFRDADGRPPRHTFFYPLDEYQPHEVNALADLCRLGFAEIELHLHHDNDTAENLRETLLRFREIFAEQHGMLARQRDSGEVAYGFVHGNWALCNARPDGRWCGVNNELSILRETGCYADFTMPAAPDVSQSRKLNSIYYASDIPGQSRSHDWGIDLGHGDIPDDGLLMIQGPLVMDWSRPKWGVLPRLENGCLQMSQPPDIRRIDLWLRAHVQAPARPDWFFVKLHAHGATEDGQEALLGEAMVRFHEALALRSRHDSKFHYHYVTAREMYNLAKAAEAGWQGSVADARDFLLLWNGAAAARVPLTETANG